MFREGAESVGCEVSEFFLGDFEIKGCKSCFGGDSSRECPCVQHDGMEKIYSAVRDCDVIVLASPLYYWSISGQLKTAIDRLFALEEGSENLLRGNGKTAALIMAAEGHGFEDATMYFDHLTEHLKWKKPREGALRRSNGYRRHRRTRGASRSSRAREVPAIITKMAALRTESRFAVYKTRALCI